MPCFTLWHGPFCMSERAVSQHHTGRFMMQNGHRADAAVPQAVNGMASGVKYFYPFLFH